VPNGKPGDNPLTDLIIQGALETTRSNVTVDLVAIEMLWVELTSRPFQHRTSSA
jgi:hypothetical protein